MSVCFCGIQLRQTKVKPHRSPSAPSYCFKLGFGRLPKWPTGADCKSAGYAFDGSNPSPTTTFIPLYLQAPNAFEWFLSSNIILPHSHPKAPKLRPSLALRRHSDNQAAVTGDVGRGIPSQKHHRIARRRQKFSGAFGGGFHEGSVTLSNETNVKLPELREQTAKPASKVAFIMIVCRLKIHTVLV